MSRTVESRTLDGIINGLTVSNLGTLYSLHGTYGSGSFVPIVSGDGPQQYSGRSITPRYLTIRWAMTASDTTNIFSIIVIQTKGNWVNQGDMANIYEVTSTTYAPLSPVDTTFNSRFRVLYRREFVLDTDDSVRRGLIKLGPKLLHKINFSDGSGTTETGHLMLGVITDSSTTPHPSFSAYWRLYYKDA